jgi:hypothetical protein
MPKKSNSWFTHLQVVWKKGKAKNPKYKYGQAMKDAKKTYKKN